MAEFKASEVALLRSGCAELGIYWQPQQQEQVLAYLELLHKWNSAYNLSAVRAPAQMITRHVLDSLAIASLISGERVADVGSGAGLPGVPLAILYPQRQFALIDSNGKKARFLFQVKTALGLDNMQVHQQRVESLRPAEPFDVITSRAFASLADMVAGCSHLLAANGRYLAMKGAYPEQELVELDPGIELVKVHTLRVPGLSEQRHLVELKKQIGESSIETDFRERV